MGRPLYMLSVVDRNVGMRHMTVMLSTSSNKTLLSVSVLEGVYSVPCPPSMLCCVHYCLALCFVHLWCTVSGGVMAESKNKCLMEYKYLSLTTV
jgi:hypothetical protein